MNIRVALDAGHGMGNSTPRVFDPGCESSTLREADIALTLALTFKFVFGEEGIPFYMIRSSNAESRPLRTRPLLAESADCTHYLCLHVNDGPGAAHGFEVLYRSETDRALGRVMHTAGLSAFGMADRGMKPEDQSQHNTLRVFDFDGPVAYGEHGFIGSDGDMSKVLSRTNRIKYAELMAAYFKGLMED